METVSVGAWVWIQFGRYKNHFCPSELAADLSADIESRGGETLKIETVSKGNIDLPGMILSDRPWEDVPIESFILGIPSQDFEYFLRELEDVGERKFVSGKSYYKIHGWLACVVVTPEQRMRLLETMNKMLPTAKKRSEEANERFRAGLAKAAGHFVRPAIMKAPKGSN